MHLVLDVGNTETVLALFAPGREGVEGRWRVSTHVPRTPDEYVLLLSALLRSSGHDPGALTRVVLGSVVPSASDVLREAAARLGSAELVVIDPTTRLPIVLDVEEPRTVGADRIANTMAASQLFGRDCIVVDLGTATTYDCITADGRFQGGVIAPGLMSGKEWLAARTAKLPLVEFIPPRQVIGKRTESCIHSGIFFSAMDAIAGMVERVRAEWDAPDPLVVATGGFSPLVARHVRAFDHVEPLLTLMGLELAGEYVVGDGSRADERTTDAKTIGQRHDEEAVSKSTRKRGMDTFEPTGRLREHLNGCGVAELFEVVRSSLAAHLLDTHQVQTANGVNFAIADPKVGNRVALFGVFAGYFAHGSVARVSRLVSVSIAPPALDRGGEALARLDAAVQLEYWFHHGGQAFSVESSREWETVRPLMLDFIDAVMATLDYESTADLPVG